MTGEAWALLALAAAVLLVGGWIGWTVRPLTGRVITTANHKPVSVESPETAAAIRRLAVAAETLVNDKPVQKDRDKYHAMSESLLHSIHAVRNAKIEHPEGLRPDVIIGREQGIALIQEMLDAELTEALK